MDFKEELKSGVKTDIEVRDLVKESGIEELELPVNLQPIKNRIEGVLKFRNENQKLDPNMFELMDIMTSLNNSLARDGNASSSQREDLKRAFDVLYTNVLDDGFIGNHLGDKNSNIYQMFENVKNGLYEPEEIDSFTAEYLNVLSGVNLYQRQQLKEKNIAYPNDFEKSIIENRDSLNIPEHLKDITLKVQDDISMPEIMLDKNIGIE